jgi:type VI secretion system protein ImpC
MKFNERLLWEGPLWSFIADIRDHPEDEVPRRIFADWLEDHGEIQFADYLRLECDHAEFSQLDEVDKKQSPLRSRSQAFQELGEGEWSETIAVLGIPPLLEARRGEAGSGRHQLRRLRGSRVQITFDVETLGSVQKIEYPFLIGVLADLSGQPRESLRPVRDRKFTPIDRDNFNQVLERAAPRLAIEVRNYLSMEDARIAVELSFRSMEDFEPARVAAQVPALKRLLDVRSQLSLNPNNQELERIRAIDRQMSAQLSEIMHAPEFQKLEGTWRGLHYLVHQSETGESLQLTVLNVTKRELLEDRERGAAFDRGILFRNVYSGQYGVLGGHLYGMLIADYEFDRSPEDVRLLGTISQAMAYSHALFISAASPRLFNLESFEGLTEHPDWATHFAGDEYAAWNRFRDSEESRYIALTLPRVLARLPYGEGFSEVGVFNYDEFINGYHPDKCLWMNAAWAYAVRVNDSFARYGWMARTVGMNGGKVEDLPSMPFPQPEGEQTPRRSTEVALPPDHRTLDLSRHGFLPVVCIPQLEGSFFLSAQSCYRQKHDAAASPKAAAEWPAKINTLLCVSRFAHYVKQMARNKIGTFMDRDECEKWLNDWINQYVIADPSVAGGAKARYPLAEANIEIRATSGKPHYYEAVISLRPHYQFDGLDTVLRVVAEFPGPSS